MLKTCSHPDRDCRYCFDCDSELPLEKWIQKRIDYHTYRMSKDLGGYKIIQDLELVLKHFNELKDKND